MSIITSIKVLRPATMVMVALAMTGSNWAYYGEELRVPDSQVRF